MNILITGGKGYIGTNLKVIGNNHFITTSDYNSVLAEDYKHLYNFDGVVHLAALSGIQACEDNPQKAIKDNILSADNIFKLACDRGIPVVFTSSQAAKNPKTSIYAMMKWTVENLATMYNDLHGGNIYTVRLANVYGGYEYLTKKNTCIKQFITKYKNNEPFEVHNEGKQIRDFVHVFDVCDAILKILEVKPECSQPIDIGSGRGISITGVTRLFPRQKVVYSTRDAGVDSSVANLANASFFLGYKPKRNLEDYIKKEIQENE